MNENISVYDKELRSSALVMQKLLPTFTEKRLKSLGLKSSRSRKRIKDKSLHIEERWISRNHGSKMRIALFRPLNAKGPLPVIIWFHGGGYAFGTPEQSFPMIKKILQRIDCIVIAPAYYLSVEAPYPGALHDAYRTLLWVRDQAESLNICQDQIVVGGESAGGGLAVSLALYARDKAEVTISLLIALYPMLDDRMSTGSSRNNKDPLWNSESNLNAWKLYLGDSFGNSDVSIYAAPARAEDLSSLPKTLCFVGEQEPFHDETVSFMEGLRNQGVEVDFKVYPGCFHGFDVVCPKAEVSKRAVSSFLDSLHAALKT